MPHVRKRHIEPLLRQSLGFSPIVGLLGHRQTGKTTLLEKMSDAYVTLDSIDNLTAANSDPVGFLDRVGRPLAIDECQLSPALFPALKEHVRTHKERCRFLLSGSVRFTSRKAIRESLTGRILNLELLPMTVSELLSLPRPEKFKKFFEAAARDAVTDRFISGLCKTPVPASALKKEMTRYLDFGGLPGICFSRKPAFRQSFFKSHIETILNRDLRLIIETTLPFQSLLTLLKVMAVRQGRPLEWSALRAETGIGVITLKKMVSAFEALFLIRLVPSKFGQKKTAYFFEDQGLARHLSGGPFAPLSDLTRGIYSNIREQWMYDPEFQADFYQHRTRSGASVPLVISHEGVDVGIIPALETVSGTSAIRSAQSFAGKSRHVIIAHSGDSIKILSNRIVAIPWTSLIA